MLDYRRALLRVVERMLEDIDYEDFPVRERAEMLYEFLNYDLDIDDEDIIDEIMGYLQPAGKADGSNKISYKLNEDQATTVLNSKWWIDYGDEERVGFQLYEEMLCMPWEEFTASVKRLLNEKPSQSLSKEKLKEKFKAKIHCSNDCDYFDKIQDYRDYVLEYVNTYYNEEYFKGGE